MARVRCCTDLDKTVLTQNFDKRNWITVSSDEDWNFFWLAITYFNRTNEHFSLQGICYNRSFDIQSFQ